MRRLLLALVLLAGCGDDSSEPSPSSAVASSATLPPLHVEGAFFRDPEGRAVILHGVNYSHRTKTWPFASWQRREHFERIRSWGFNCVRYLVVWEGVEPQPGVIDHAYLAEVERAVRWARQCGLYVLVDFHQDLHARVFGGDGAPAWACVDDLVEPNDLWKPWFLTYFSREVRASFDRLFSDEALQDHYAQAWLAVVERVRRHPNVIGYDLMNEPFYGNTLPWDFERDRLTGFYRRLAERIRAVDRERAVFVEPLALTANIGLPTFLEKPCEKLVFAPHYYDPLVAEGVGYVFAAQAALPWIAFAVHKNRATEWGAPMFLGEFGANAQDGLADQLDAADHHLIAGWSYWNYNPDLETNDVLEQDILSVVRPDGGEKPQLDLLVRPYPRALAGTPSLMNFDRRTRVFSLAWSGPAGTSVIHVPRRHYPQGVTVTGAPAWSYEDERLTITHPAGDHSITVSP